MGERPSVALIPSVFYGIHYEVRLDSVVRWWEPGTTKSADYDGKWFAETLAWHDEIPLADTILLSRYAANHHPGFYYGHVIIEGAVAAAMQRYTENVTHSYQPQASGSVVAAFRCEECGGQTVPFAACNRPCLGGRAPSGEQGGEG